MQGPVPTQSDRVQRTNDGSGTGKSGSAACSSGSRSSASGSFIDVCESTARMTSLEQYLQRAAILGNDPRAGAMAMLFATELMK